MQHINAALKTQPPNKEVVCRLQTDLPAYGCGRGGTRTPDFYCVILKSNLPMLPIRPFNAFLFGFLHFSGARMSSESIISTAFFLIATLLQHLQTLFVR